MFGKKKSVPIVEYNYKNWEEDFGFLNLVLSRKKKIVEEFLINPIDKQLSKSSYILDDDIEPMVNGAVKEVISEISDEYKNFLIRHYFGSLDNMIKYITEEFYVDFVNDAVSRNNKKIEVSASSKAVELIKKYNNIGK